MRVAVTGADGFVGRHLCAHLASRGDEVLALAGPPAKDGVDVLDADGLRASLAPFAPEGVIHLAGISSVARSHEAAVETFRVNCLGAVNLCAILKAIAPKSRLLLVGSGEMYGAPSASSSPTPERITELSPLLPTSPYAASKVAAEVGAFQFHRAYGLAVIAARSFNHIGPGQAQTFAIPSFARQLEAIRASGRSEVLRVGNLDPVRDFSHVLDVVAAYALLLDRGAPGEAYNVCSGSGRSMQSMVEEMIALSGANTRIEVDPTRLRPIEIQRLVGDPSKLRALGWEPRYGVRKALEDALAEARPDSTK